MSTVCIILFILLAIIVVPFTIGAFLYNWFGLFKFFYHDILLWHMPNKHENHWYDGCSIHSICKHCEKEIIQDSQGNWF